VTEHRPAQVTSPLGPEALLLRRMTGREELGRASFFEVELLSEDDQIGLNKLLGKPMSVHLEVADGKKRHWSGLVSRFAHAGALGRYTVYRATVRPWLWFLSRTANCRIFQKMTVPDIIKQVFRDHGFSDLKDSLTGSYREWDYLVQYRETDFNFVTRLMEQEGIYFYIKHEESIHKLVLADGYSAHEAAPGYEEVPYFPPDAHDRRERDHVDTLDVSHSVQTGAYVLEAYDFERPKADLMTKLAAPKSHEQAEMEIFDYPGEYIQSSDGENYVRARLESLHTLYEQIKGQGNARGIAVGGLFSLKGYPREDQNREYLVTSAEYTLSNPDYESNKGETGPIFRCAFSALDSQIQYRTPATTPKPHVKGPQTAVVVGPKGEEIWTDKYSRVKVQFHWDREGKSNENSSCWVRVAQLWAGAKWGGIHIPRIGHEVIVDFLEGDPDQPIITGRVYNADNMPPYDVPGNATQSGIKSRSSKGGSPDNFNEIRFEDKKGAEEMYIQAEKDRNILVKNDEGHNVGHDRKKSIKNDETTSVGHNRTESVGNDEKIDVTANRNETVGANEKIDVTGNRTRTVGGNETISVTGNRGVSVSGNESLTITLARQKSILLAENISVGLSRSAEIGVAETVIVGAARTTTVGAIDSLSVGASRSVTVGTGETTSVGTDQTITVGANRTLSVTGNETVKVAGNDGVKVGKNYTLEAADQIILKTGDATLTMKKDGKIVLKGKEIMIDGSDITVKGSGKIQIKASGDVVVKGSKIGHN
jgi:type VI secretion system secreted protein VgrG